MASKEQVILTAETVTRKVGEEGVDRDLLPFMQELGKRTPLDTGLLPPGVRSYAQAGEYAQLLIECPPSVNPTYNGGNLYLVAQPWRVIIADLFQDQLRGCRLLSACAVTDVAQPIGTGNGMDELPTSPCACEVFYRAGQWLGQLARLPGHR
jgi:hypothetical protein